MFDASVIANVLDIFDGSLTPPFAIIASHTVSRRVSDRSVALAASCTSEIQISYYVDISKTERCLIGQLNIPTLVSKCI